MAPYQHGGDAMERIIKRYQNRKLYDTHASRYITLVDIEKLVRDQEMIKIVDQKTGEDITRQILIQIIMRTEDESKLPLEGLKSWISQREETFRKAFQRTVDFSRDVVEKVEKDFSRSPVSRHFSKEDEKKGLDWEIVRDQFEALGDWLSTLFNERLRKGLLKFPTLTDTKRLSEKLQLLEAKLGQLEKKMKEKK
jgi:polyhydroxyalkanoate synthesis repressor PhaR